MMRHQGMGKKLYAVVNTVRQVSYMYDMHANTCTCADIYTWDFGTNALAVETVAG